MVSKVVLITNVPPPHRIPLWDAMQRFCDFSVYCIADLEKNRNWRVDLGSTHYIGFVGSIQIPVLRRDWIIHLSLPLKLFLKLVALSPDVVIISAYDNFQYWEALLYARLFGKKTVFWNGSTMLSSRSRSKVLSGLKKWFIRQFDAYYTYGKKATEYLKAFGADTEKIITGVNTVDVDWFKRHTTNQSTQSGGVRELLFVGQLIERKGLANTIMALKHLESENWHLTVVGNGSDKAALIYLVQTLGLETKITFAGFKQKHELVDYFSKADIFLMPSYNEVWGLVLNEALASGLFCLSSVYAGATYDLIEEGVNGFSIDPRDIDQMVVRLNRVLQLDLDKKRIKETMKVSIEEEAAKVDRAIRLALGI